MGLKRTLPADGNGWGKWHRHVWVAVITLGLNVLLFLFIPLLSQIREIEPVHSQIAGPAIRISPARDQKAEASKERQPPPSEPPPESVPDLDVRPQPPKFNSPATPELPKLDLDLPAMDVGRIKVNAPEGPPAGMTRPDKLPESSPPAQGAETSKAAPASGGYSLHEVDTRPSLMHKVSPVYPRRAKRRGIEGRVVLKFLVDTKGRVERLSVVRAEPEGVFDENAVTAVRQWRFKPGKKDGKPVPTWVQVPIRFELSR